MHPLRLFTLLAFGAGLAAAGVCADDGPDFALPAEPLELVAGEEYFLPFATSVRAEVERLLGVPAAVDDPATLKLLLAMRVHLALHFADNETAVATAAWIRSLQTDPVGRAFAGLTTFAFVEAREQNPGIEIDSDDFRQAFLREFTRQLDTLPGGAAIIAMLRGQRDKIAGITKAGLLEETRAVIAPALERRGHCGLVEADQLVRVRHRLADIVPVRDETLRALDAAIEKRTRR